jgi:hypothetical protein
MRAYISFDRSEVVELCLKSETYEARKMSRQLATIIVKMEIIFGT